MMLDKSPPSILRRDIGQILLGYYSASDEAFDQATREVARFGKHATWEPFLARVKLLEDELADVGELSQAVQDALDSPFGYFGDRETINRHFKAEELLLDLEELTAALIVTLQTRLTAVNERAKRVFEVAATNDGLTDLPKYEKTELLRNANPCFADIWGLANYVKHRDEWGEVLKDNQESVFKTLKRLGVASETAEGRQFDTWILSAAVARITGKQSLSDGLKAMIEICEQICRQALEKVQSDFSRFDTEIKARRKLNAARTREQERHAGVMSD